MKRLYISILFVFSAVFLFAQHPLYLTSQNSKRTQYKHIKTEYNINTPPYSNYGYSMYKPTYSSIHYFSPNINSRYAVRLNKIGTTTAMPQYTLSARRVSDGIPPETNKDPDNPGFGDQDGPPTSNTDPNNPSFGDPDAPPMSGNDPNNPQFGAIPDGVYVLLLMLVVYLSIIRLKRKINNN